MKNYYWKTKNGKKINVDDMSEEHLKNVLKLILRRIEEKQMRYLCDATECDIY